jgi:hypothetical protein
MRRPQCHVAGHGDQRDAPGPEHPGDFRRGQVVILDVLEDVKGGNQVAAAGLHRQFSRVGPDDVEPALARDQRRRRRVFKSKRLPAVRSQYPCVAPAGRADVQCPPRNGQPPEFPRKQCATLLVPPVVVFDGYQSPKLSRLHGLIY